MPVTERDALNDMAGDIAEILRRLAAMRHRALAHHLPLAIPASQPYGELLEQLARLKHPSGAPSR